MPNSLSMKNIRSGLYEDVYRSEKVHFDIDLSSWKKHPYSKLKSYYYIEVGAVLTYLLIRTKVTPNSITMVYAFLGILGACLFAVGNTPALLAGIFVFFSKSIPDWIDGHIARMKGQTSQLGRMLDEWGAQVNTICFQLAICFYVAVDTGSDIYYLLGIVVSLTPAINFRSHVYQHINKPIKSLNDENRSSENAETNSSFLSINSLKKLATALRYNGRSRYTDLVLLVILVEIYFNKVFLSAVFAILWALINIIYFFYSLLITLQNKKNIFN
jgi:hypothetical protein